MSREIKFRAWYKEEKRMCYGIDGDDEPYWRDGDCLGDVEMVNFELSDCNYIWEQSTGLIDKNGKEIFEGDIVNITGIVETDDSELSCIIDTESVVYYDKKHARFDVIDDPEDDDLDYHRRRYFLFISENRENIEVIGNIHENTDLLEKGEE